MAPAGLSEASQQTGHRRGGWIVLQRFVALRTSSFAAALGAVRGALVLTLPRSFAEAIGVPGGVRLHAPPVELPPLSLRAVSATASRDDATSKWLRGLVREVVARG